MRIFRKFLFFFIIPLMVFLSSIGAFIFFETINTMQANADDHLFSLAEHINSGISTEITHIQNDLNVIKTTKNFDEYYNYKDLGLNDPADRRLIIIQGNLMGLANLRKEYSSIRFYDLSGTALVNINEGKRSYKAVQVSEADWFRKTLNLGNGETYISDVYTSEEYPEPMLTVSQPVFYMGRLKGVIAIDSKVTHLFDDLIAQETIGESGHSYLVSDDGRILVHPDSSKIYEDVSNNYFSERIFEGYRGIYTGLCESGEETMRIVYMPVLSKNLGLVVEMPITEIFAPAREMKDIVLPVLIIIILMLTIVSFILIKRITGPIEILTDVTGRMRNNLGLRVDIKSHDEIGILARSYNRMADELEDYAENMEKKVEERTQALSIAKSNLENVMSSIHEGLMVIDTGYIIRDVNLTIERMTGLSKEEIVGKHCYEISHKRNKPCQPPHDICLLGEVLKNGKPTTVTHKHFDREGNVIYLELTSSPIRDENGEITHVIEVSRDITERKKMEEEINNNNEELTAINEELRASNEELDLSKSRMDAQNEELTAINEELRATNEELDLSKSRVDAQNEELTAINEELRATNEMLDITKSKLEKSNLRLFHTNEMTGLFSDILRHDLSNKTSVIKNISGEMLEEEAESEMGGDYRIMDLKTINAAAQHINNLIADAKKMAQLENSGDLEKEKMDLFASINDQIGSFQGELAEKEIVIENKIKGSRIFYANPVFQDIFQNLLSNAIKYSPEGSKIEIDSEDADSHYILSIRDMGEGIPDEYKTAVFKRLERVHKKGVKGTGLGLAIARKIAELHNSKIWIEDNYIETEDEKGVVQKIKRGSIFKVEVPKWIEKK